MPKRGPAQSKLIVVLSLDDGTSSTNLSNERWSEIVSTSEAASQITRARERLSDLVPAYMIPSVWIVVSQVPLLASAKVDRKQVGLWLDDIDEMTYQKVLDLDNIESSSVPTTEATEVLKGIWAKVLKVTITEVKPNKSWLCKFAEVLVVINGSLV